MRRELFPSPSPWGSCATGAASPRGQGASLHRVVPAASYGSKGPLLMLFHSEKLRSSESNFRDSYSIFPFFRLKLQPRFTYC